ncbi:MAG: TonB-dependent receptor [Bryobacterales bacterium]
MSSIQFRIALAATLFLTAVAPSFAQQSGTIVGIVYDAATGNPLPQIKVEIAGPATFDATTDTDGSFLIEVPVGTYKVSYTSQRFLPTAVDGVEVSAGQIADATTVMSATGEVTTVDVVESVLPQVATAEAMLTERKLAQTVSDSISGAEIKAGTASDAAGALEKVTGVSVVNDRFVFVRGLSERYSATTLNNAMLATTEPERRVVPLDLFPANLIDNIKVLKTYTPDLPGEFSAGLVQIETTEFPTKPTMSISYSTGFNTQTQGSNFLSYPGGGLDYFGYDDGTRSLPSSLPRDTRIDRSNFSASELQSFGKALSDNWQMRPKQNFWRPTQTWNIVAGNSYGKLGLVGAVTFSNNPRSIFNQDRIFYQPNPLVATGELRPDQAPPLPKNIFKYNQSTESSRIGAAFNASYRINEKHKVTVKNFLSHDTDNETRFYTGFHQDFGTDVRDTRLRFIERQILSTQVEGEHLFPSWGNSIFSWQYAYSNATRDEPDLRESLYLLNDVTGKYEYFDDSQSAFRMFNNLDEGIHNPKVDYMLPFYGSNWSGSLKVGANLSFRERDFRSRRLRFALRGRTNIDPTLPANELFGSDNIRPNGFEINETTRITDAYTGTRDIYGYYGMLDFNLAQKWRFIGGLRIEDVNQDVTTFDPFNPELNRQPAPFNKVNYLPSVNVTRFLTPKQNLRFAFSKTVARPDFRELALFDFLDIVGGRQTIGNPKLVQTEIQNYDVRWEYFPGGNQLIAASFFYKDFNKPIEQTIRATVGLLTTFDNATAARNYGVELEFRRGLDFIGPKLRQFSVSSNFTFVDSNIDLSEVQNIVLTNLIRPMQGQSRYVGNFIAEWARPEWRSTARFYTNYFSRRISDVGVLGLPDVYQEGVTTLDFVYELNLREDGKWKMRMNAQNLTNALWDWTQGGLTFQRYTMGRTFTVGTSFQIF